MKRISCLALSAYICLSALGCRQASLPVTFNPPPVQVSPGASYPASPVVSTYPATSQNTYSSAPSPSPTYSPAPPPNVFSSAPTPGATYGSSNPYSTPTPATPVSEPYAATPPGASAPAAFPGYPPASSVASQPMTPAGASTASVVPSSGAVAAVGATAPTVASYSPGETKSGAKTKRTYQRKKLSHWLEMARDLDPSYRSPAIPALAAFAMHEESEEALDVLCEIASMPPTSNPNHMSARVAAIGALGEVAAARSAPKVIPLLVALADGDDEPDQIRHAAIAGMLQGAASWEAKGSAEALRKTVAKAPRSPLRNIVMMVLTTISREQTDYVIRQLVKDEKEPTNVSHLTSGYANSGSLEKRLKPSSLLRVVSHTRQILDEGAETDAAYRGVALQIMINTMLHDNKVIARIRDRDELEESLIGQLRAKEADIRTLAIRALSLIGANSSDVRESLTAVVADDDAGEVRLAAASTVRYMEIDRDALCKKLFQQFEESEEDARRAMLVEVVGRLNSQAEETLDHLKAAAKDDAAEVRVKAIQALAATNPKQATETVVAGLNDEDRRVQDQALRAIVSHIRDKAAEASKRLQAMYLAAQEEGEPTRIHLLQQALISVNAQVALPQNAFQYGTPVPSSQPSLPQPILPDPR